MALTGALFALLVGANVFTLVLRAFGTDRWIAELLGGLGGGTAGALAAVLGALALCAFVLDAFELIFVVVPVVMPPLLMRVPDAAWVAVLALLILQASFLLPPFGYSVMMVRHRLPRPPTIGALAGALVPYLVAQAIVVAAVIAFPALVWRGPAAEVAVNAPAPVSDDDVQRMLDQQFKAVEPESAPETASAPRP
jgi:TRAP-type mannitol/chloroaromatic compound transport system permease large subunit